MGPTAHFLVLFIACFLVFCKAKYFPKLNDFAEKSSIKASSTCGETETNYCEANTLNRSSCTEEVCKYACCPTCSTVLPRTRDLSTDFKENIYSGQPRPGTTQNSLGFNSEQRSYIQPRRLLPVDHKTEGFSICVWVNQTSGNRGTIFSKSSLSASSVIYGFVLEDFSITFYYTSQGSNITENIRVTPLASQYPADPNGWHFICVMVIDRELSYFLDGDYVGTDAKLTNTIAKISGTPRVGQMFSVSQPLQYDGLMQDIFFYNRALTNREVTELYTGIFPTTYIASECRCPPTHPKISASVPGRKCAKNWGNTEGDLAPRLADTAHPVEFATDGDNWSYWLSQNVDQVTIELDLLFGQIQMFHIVSQFYGPLPAAILIERSVNYGETYKPWQYYAVDCQKSFGMPNNGRLSQPDSVNCQQQDSTLYNAGGISFAPDQGQSRPYGAGCHSLYCSQKFLDFIRVTNVRIHLYNHTLFPTSVAKYFGLSKLILGGRCECHGNAKNARYIPRNETNNGTCVCECEPDTFTEGEKCNRCQAMYNNKAFVRGNTFVSYPCIKCECYNHATSCYYNQTLDSFPHDRNRGGGGVCINCQDHTAGQHCDSCEEGYYRETGKNLNDTDVCTPCRCSGPGVKPGKHDCVKDNSDGAILAGQCECKENVTGRACTQCKPGYYDLKVSHATGCIACNCDVRGTVNGDVTCDVTSGQCRCKSDVTGRRCDQCLSRFYNLTRINSRGCQPCLCNMSGSLSQECDKTSGQCLCKNNVTGRQCERCDSGFHSLDTSGCQSCRCSRSGTRPAAFERCDQASGQCQCKNYVSGYSCDQCKRGYYNLQQSNDNGCTWCNCDARGTLGTCNDVTGICTCKRNVMGQYCNTCPGGYYNLSSNDPNGCEPCGCYAKGTLGGDRVRPGAIGCHSSTGSCPCLSNVRGLKCDQCVVGFVWNQTGQGCISCKCDPDGSALRTCNDTGFCTCKSGTGVGGQFCDRCIAGYHSFIAGRCSPCGCNPAGITQDGCNARGCFYCKPNVEGFRCDQCKRGTQSLKQENPFGCSGVPSQQGPPIVRTLSSTTLSVLWDPPDQPNGLITSYELYRNGSLVHTDRNNSRKFNDTGLTPDSLYGYYVITHTDGGSIRSFNDGKLYRTEEDAPYGVSRPNISDIRARSSKAVWSYPSVRNGKITSFYLESTNPRDANVIVHCQGLVLSCDVINLRPYTVYNFTIRVCTSAGCTKSQANSVRTRSAAPDSQPAPNVVPLPGGKSFIVTWDKPAEPNGIILRYELHQRPFPAPPDNNGREVYSSSPSANPGADYLRNTTISRLFPFTWYEFRVVTYTAVGYTASRWTRQRTAEAVPAGESRIRPRSFAISSSGVNITWSLPAFPNGIIIMSRVYIYTNDTSYTIPVLARTVNRTSSAVVSGLQPYTMYRFTVTSCNSVGCTRHSARTETKTLAGVPSGQTAPSGKPLNSTHLRLTWSLPAQPNGPVPPEYHVTRSHAAFYSPPINAVEGAHFPGLGYYLLRHDVMPEGVETQIEFWFRTRVPHGLIMFLASATQQDFLAVEIRDGVPWFIFNCQDGTAQISINSSPKFNDDKWHFVEITRNRRRGQITVDRNYRGVGESPPRASYIDRNTGVYIGGVKPGLLLNQDILSSVYSLNNSIHFIGCLNKLRLQNNLVSLDTALEKVNIEPVSSGCPMDHASGFYLKGGGYLSLKKDIFEGNTIYHLSFDFKTFYTSGILVFVYAEGAGEESYFTVGLNSGNIRVLYRTRCCYGNITVVPSRPICDGTWHTLSLTNFAKSLFTVDIDGISKTDSPIADLHVTSELYFGGLPFGSRAAQKAGSIGLRTGTTFGGCFRNIKTSRDIDLLTEVSSLMNVDMSGCPGAVNGTHGRTCYNATSQLVYTGTDNSMVDGQLDSFTDYLYRVESKQPGTQGGGKSSWFALRSGEGAPEFNRAPYDVISLPGGKSVRVAWQPPQVYRGVLRGYILRAYHASNSSIDPVEIVFNEISVLNATLSGLEPYTWYDVRVAAFTRGGTGESPGTRVRTLESAPEGVRVPDVQRYPYSLFISWQVPHKPNGIITAYILTINNSEVYRGINQTFNLTGLAVYTRHLIQLTACTQINCTQGTPTVFYTAEIPPQGVRPPDVRILGAHSAEVTWQEPGTRNGRMRGYQILVNAIGSPSWEMRIINTTSEVRFVVITNLTAGTWYAFRLKAINGGGATLSSPTTQRTVESSPEDIPPPWIRGLSPYSILVTILEPGLPNGNITRYELYKVNGRDEVIVLNGTSKNYTESGLTPYTAYYFRSRICTAKGCGSSIVGNGRTLEASPNGTVSLNISILNSTTVLANWSPVHTPNGIVFYKLIVDGEFLIEGSFEVENDTRVVAMVVHPLQEMLFTELLPYTTFLFQVNASNTAGYVLSNIVQGRTGQGAPIGLAAPNVTILNSTAAEITWLPPARHNGILMFYEIMRIHTESGRRMIVNTSLQLSLVMTDLEPYTKYEFQVGASTSGGKAWSDVTEVRTLQDVPSPIDPPTFPQVDSRTLQVHWDRVSKPNGIIIHYILYRNNTHRTIVSSNITTLIVTDLNPFTVYVFSVAACTIVGCSNSSLSRPVKTLEDVPQGQSSPVLSHASGPSVMIRWSAPTVTNGKISEYVIQRRSEIDQSNISSVARVPTNESAAYLDSSVVPCLRYYYRVIAYTTAGGGTPSPWSNITTQEGAPEFVPKATTRSLNSTAVQVTWSIARSQCNVTHYIVRVLENRRNYSGFRASDLLSFIITDLHPYKVYNIVIAGCTASACRESEPSDVRTHPGLPSNQSPPSAQPLSSTSLRVTWDPPAVPGGSIENFVLYRRTLDEPLTENFTMTSYVEVYSGITRIFDDRGLGIYSEQQYKVTMINAYGNTTSEDSQPFRTGPAPPRAGVLLRGLALNHTSVMLNWSVPEVKFLLGDIVNYIVRFKDIVADVEYTFMNDLPGSARNVVVTPLRPSKDYSFQVILNNGAGTRGSNIVTVRTLDGAPEGFDRPHVRTINSTSIEVTWSPPRISNGQITTYHIYANSARVGSTSSLYFNATSLIPFTVYNIEVEVCTVYACVRSDSSSARTLPAVPQFLDSPTLSPGRRNILVTWDSPRRPNGEILEYVLYRRVPTPCPTSPSPIKACTYIECAIDEELCGTTCYSPRTKECCNGVLHDKDLTKTCCNSEYKRKQSPSDVCCGGRFYTRTTDYQCCHGNYKLVPPGQVCCQDNRNVIHVGDGNACCGGRPYNNNTKYCVCGVVYNDNTRKCCGGQVVALAQTCCGGTESGRIYTEDSGKKCCGNHYVPVSSLCCQSGTGFWKIYNYTSVKQREDSSHVCCGMNRISAGLSCCNDRGFNSSLQVCADERGCGNGTVCDKASRNTAKCDRCDFQNSLHCGYTPGYYTPNPPTPPSQDCSTFTQVVSGNSTLRHHNDESLEPFTEYEYYLVVHNTEGNTSSPYVKNRTLMDAPEGLGVPDVIVRSARSIEVVYSPPTKPNGVISQYKLTRVDLNTTTRTLVYRGLNLSYLDTGVLPITGYFYILEACTALCANISSRKISTRESTPENVYPPMLRALSAYSIEITWQRPGRPNGVITGYNISRVNDTGHIIYQWPGNNMIYVDNSSDIRPYTNYSYIITACTKVGCTKSDRGFVTTLEAPPESVYLPELQIRSARVIEVNWREPAIPNGEIIWYTLYRDNVSICNTSGSCLFETPSWGKYRYIDRGLQPHTLYSYNIEASTIAGSSKSSNTRTTTPQSTPEGIPSPTLTPQSSTSILVTWTAPANPNGVIRNYSVIQDTVIEHQAGLDRSFTITGLRSFTVYNFQIKACTLIGCGVGNRSDARTLESAPSDQPAPSLVALSDAIVLVTWRSPHVPNGIIIQYEVERRIMSSTPVVVFVSKQTFVWQTRDSNLLPYRDYQYRIRAINSAGSTRSAWATVRTQEGAPARFYFPTIHVLNATAVTASWKEPREPNGIITRYELWTRSVNSPGDRVLVASSTTPEQNVTVSGLRPNTNYEFQLAASTVGGTGYSGWILAETLEAPPVGLRPLTASKPSNGRELIISWDEPTQPNGRITNYIVYREGVRVYIGISRTFRLRRLQPFTSYQFQLEACTSAGCTKGSIQLITTAEISPEFLQAPVFAVINSTYITLEWQPPALPNGIIILYQVFRVDTPFGVYNSSDTNTTSYTDIPLQPYTMYGYKVRAQNSAGATESRVARVTTRQAPPELINRPVIEAVTSLNIEISWSPPRQPNGVITSYTLRRNETVVNHWGSTVLQYRDTSVNPDTFYGYWLTVCTGGGCSNSPRTVVRSGEGRPGAVRAPRLTVLTAYAINIMWQPPVISNGIVIRYELYLGNTDIYNGTDMSFVISSLQPYTVYAFHVSACTKTGCTTGPSSEARTHEAPPAGLDRPTYDVFGPRIVEVNWALPQQPNGVILYYTLHRNDSMIYNGSDTSYKDLSVQPFSYYAYVVSAFNSVGHVSSPVLYTDRTLPGTPENVTKPQLTPLSGTEIQISWSAPAKPNGIITKYLVLYGIYEVNVGSNMTYIARNLASYTVYSFRIRACTSDSSCAVSDVESTRTLEGIPRGQPAPVIPNKTVKARSLLVTWGEPGIPNGVILRYIVHRTSDNGESSTQIFSGLAFNYNDTTVLPYQTYQYKVSAVNSAGMVSSDWTTVTTRSAPPEQVSTPRILTVGQTSLVVAFDPPGRPNGIITKYIVQVNEQSVSEGVSLEQIIRNLEPYTDYSLRVLACTDAGCTASQAISNKTATGQPSKVEEPTFGEVTANSIEVNWKTPVKPNGDIKRYSVVYKFVCSDNCVSKRAVSETTVNVGLNTSYVITGLEPYSLYEIVIQIFNEQYSTDSVPVRKRTGPSDPLYVRLPVLNNTGNSILIDWSKSFKLNGPLFEYTLRENDFLIFRGTSTNSGQLPGRAESEYIYVVSATTMVNGEKRTVKSVPFNIQGRVSSQKSEETETWYKTVWFLVLLAVLLILAVFGVVAVCLRRTSGDRTVFVRERDPLPRRFKSRSAAASSSSNYTPSEAQFNLGMVDLNHDRASRASTYIGESEKAKYEQEGSIDWEGYEGLNESYPYHGNYDDEKTLTDDFDDIDASRSFKYQNFPDTKL